MTSSEIRSKFLKFFEKRGHIIIPSASLVTTDEKGITNATLFNTAGMQPLVPYLLGKTHPQGNRLVDSQKCLRTIDIDDIGDKTHATFFEMLGNWSLGDYFKNEAIAWSYEFLTDKNEGLGLDPSRLYITVFEGDSIAPKDDEAADIWREIFKKNNIGGNRIFYMPASMNWWEAGENGPCGPDTEMYYDISGKFAGKGLSHEEFLKADSIRDVVEVWNDVFMQYEKKDGKIIGNLPKPSVDTGAGLERLTMTLQGVDNIYDTDLLKHVMDLIRLFKGGHDNSESEIKSERIIADHLRASVFMISDGVEPSAEGRGYVLRKILRRACLNADSLNLEISLTFPRIALAYIKQYSTIFPELKQNEDKIVEIISDEVKKVTTIDEKSDILLEKKFDTYMQSLGKTPITIKKVISGQTNPPDHPFITAHEAFGLFSSQGIPKEKILKFIRRKNFIINIDDFEKTFNEEFKKHQELSRAGAEQKFKGGLVDANDPKVIKYHTATHLLHQALYDVLGDSVGQKGSNITPERLRFDFSYNQKMTDEQKKQVEDIVNEKIKQAIPVKNIIMPKVDAEKSGAKHFFSEKYGEEISIYFIGDNIETAYSKEFCGGPHVKNTSELAGPEGKWKFKIQKEEASSQGIRRIKAVLE